MSVVLIIDDDQFIREVMRQLLEDSGYSVLEAENGRDGVDVFSHHADRIAAVIIDLRMPMMSGRATYQAIIKTRPDIPVLLTSGYCEDITDLIALRAPACTSFLMKPFDPPLLLARIEKFVEQNLPAGD